MEYTFRIKTLKNKSIQKKRLLMDFEEGYEILSSFLEEEGMQFYEELKKLIDDVLEGEESSVSFRGNRYQAYIDPHMTVISDTMADDEIGDWCSADTEEVLQLLEDYHEAVQKLKENE